MKCVSTCDYIKNKFKIKVFICAGDKTNLVFSDESGRKHVDVESPRVVLCVGLRPVTVKAQRIHLKVSTRCSL